MTNEFYTELRGLLKSMVKEYRISESDASRILDVVFRHKHCAVMKEYIGRGELLKAGIEDHMTNELKTMLLIQYKELKDNIEIETQEDLRTNSLEVRACLTTYF